jgi:hypothetical protein
MPVTRLYVEGALDQRVIVQVLAGQAAVEARGTKHDLHHIVRRELEEGKSGIAYLRDRDFDTEPPGVATASVSVDRVINSSILGYRWQRTELENYLLEPPVVAAALGLDLTEFSVEIAKAASTLLVYTAARWTLGQLRARTRSITNINTRPGSLSGKVFPLPASFAESDVIRWLETMVSDVTTAVAREFNVAAVKQHFESYKVVIAGKSGPDLLVWYSGKDLFGVLAAYFKTRGIDNSSDAMERVVAWLETPGGVAEAMNLLPEWRSLGSVLAK